MNLANSEHEVLKRLTEAEKQRVMLLEEEKDLYLHFKNPAAELFEKTETFRNAPLLIKISLRKVSHLWDGISDQNW